MISDLITRIYPPNLQSIDVADELKTTIKRENFLFYDSGANDSSRFIVFATDENIKLLSLHRDWFCDGTFHITPTIFRQVYTIHIIKSNKVFPVVYCLLPDKKKNAYVRLFKVLSEKIDKKPNSINVDFEKGVFSAAEKVFKNCEVNGCFFHLSQSFFRRVQLKDLFTKIVSNDEFRKNFKMTQALAFLPESDVITGFIELSNYCSSFKRILAYVERTYIGRVNKKTNKRNTPRFPISTWNLYNRTLSNLPRTNNNVESWHSEVSNDVKSHLTVNKVIQLFREELGHVEALLFTLV